MKILILTSVYKDFSLNNKDSSTNIVNSFAYDWVRQGHEVVVIHNSHCYPYIIHLIPEFIKKRLAKKMGFSIAPLEAVKRKEYFDNGVKVYRLPIKKYLPHTSPNDRKIKKQVDKICSFLKECMFYPDVITGHWASPQMEIISQLKEIFNCNTAVVLHGTGYIDSQKFNAKQYLANIDFLGARSVSQANQIKELLALPINPFVCYSGVPDSYLLNYKINTRKFKNCKRWIFTYVGRLVSYKNVDSIIKALAMLKDVDWVLNIVGDGALKVSLEKLTHELNCQDKVLFHGKVSRDKVMSILSETHVFTMISTNEIFGLVYLEAMAASCITIASKNGGVDGIIVNKQNGFLCNEGDSTDLFNTISDIVRLNQDELTKISFNGNITAFEYSDSKVAKTYLSIISEEKK